MKTFREQLVGIPGIGPRKAGWIAESGIRSIARLKSLSKAELTSIRGVGPCLAEDIIRHLGARKAPKASPAGASSKAGAAARAEPARAEAARTLGERMRVELLGLVDVLREVFETVVILLGDRCLGAGRAGA